jgi:hypothetical protein
MELNRRASTMRKHEFHPDYLDLFEYLGSNEIKRVRIKSGEMVRRDWYIFNSPDEAMLFFNERCGVLEERNLKGSRRSPV